MCVLEKRVGRNRTEEKETEHINESYFLKNIFSSTHHLLFYTSQFSSILWSQVLSYVYFKLLALIQIIFFLSFNILNWILKSLGFSFSFQNLFWKLCPCWLHCLKLLLTSCPSCALSGQGHNMHLTKRTALALKSVYRLLLILAGVHRTRIPRLPKQFTNSSALLREKLIFLF